MSLHHTDDEVCLLCESKLEQAHPHIARWFLERVKPSWPHAHVSWSYRGKKDQEAAVSNGKSELHWPHSGHNRRVPIDISKPYDLLDENDPNTRPESLALDVFEQINGKGLYRDQFFYEIFEDIQSAGLPILWGKRWAKLGDKTHFQLEELLPFSGI